MRRFIRQRATSRILSNVTVTVTEALVLCTLLENRRRITESIRILVPVNRMKQNNVFRSRRNKSVDRSSFSSVGSLFHARGAATEKALSPVRRRVRGTTRLPHDLEYCQPMSEGLRYIPVSQKRLVNQQAQLVLDPLSDCQPVQLSKGWSHTVTRLENHNGACRRVQNSLETPPVIFPESLKLAR